uniref:5-formyltetrahydrofolate cyclo-ligase n=1 Tax=Cyanoptyche gloeocystis TaxID=77922 RepID=A0A7S2JQ16_9EUKA
MPNLQAYVSPSGTALLSKPSLTISPEAASLSSCNLTQIYKAPPPSKSKLSSNTTVAKVAHQRCLFLGQKFSWQATRRHFSSSESSSMTVDQATAIATPSKQSLVVESPPPETELFRQKQAMRALIKQRLREIPKEQKLRESIEVCERVMASEIYQSSKHIGIYVPLPSELSTLMLLEDILQPNSGKCCYVPKTNPDCSMEMLRVFSMEDITDLQQSSLKMREPDWVDRHNIPRPNALHQGHLDLLLIPGLAFDQKGGRLGRGKGYYDRYLQRVDEMMKARDTPPVFTIGLALSCQLVDQVPMDKYDHMLDAVFCPRRL